MKKLIALALSTLLLAGLACAQSAELPAYIYPGEDPILAAVANYASSLGSLYLEPERCVCIPAPVVLKIELVDDATARVYGQFWHMNYVLKGTVLESVSGGEQPAVLTLVKSGDIWSVTGADIAEDGDGYAPSILRLAGGDEALAEQFFAASDLMAEPAASIRTQFIRDYVKANNLPVEGYQDPFWEMVPLGE